MASSDKRGKMSSFPDPLELERIDGDESDPSVFDRVTAVPGETMQEAARGAPAVDEPISGLHERSTPDGALPSFRDPLEEDLPPVLGRPPASSRQRSASPKPPDASASERKNPARRPVLELELDDIEPPRPAPTGDRDSLEIELPARPIAAPVAASGPPPSPELLDMRGRYATGDFSGALVVAEGILEGAPEHEEARRCHERCVEVLSHMYLARLGAPTQVVRVALPSDQIRWLSLDHRAGFLLSLIDGSSTIEELLDISGMTPLDALRILHGLFDQRVIALGERR